MSSEFAEPLTAEVMTPRNRATSAPEHPISFTASLQNTLFALTTSLFTHISFEQKWVRKNTYSIWFKISIRKLWPPSPCLGRYQGQGGCNQNVLSRKVRSTNREPRHFHSSKHRLKTVLQSLQRVVWVMINSRSWRFWMEKAIYNILYAASFLRIESSSISALRYLGAMSKMR